MASSCMPLTFSRAASLAVVTDSRLIAKQVQCWQITRVWTQLPLASNACFGLVTTKKSRGLVVLASDGSNFSPLTLEELEENVSSDTFSELGLPSLGSGSNSLGLGSASLEESDISDVEPSGLTKLYVGNLTWDFNNQQLEDLFKAHGSVYVAEVVLDKVTGRSRGFGFVYMNTPRDAEVVIEKLNGKEVEGRILKVNYPESAEGKNQRRSGGGGWGDGNSVNRIFVANLPWSVGDGDLEGIFSQFGRVMQARVAIDRETGRSKGFGFVTFYSSDEVDKAIAEANGLEYDGRFLSVALADRKPAARSFS